MSAQKALLAKIRGEKKLLNDSRLPELENYIANTVLPGKQTIIRNNLIEHIGGMIDENITILESRKAETTKQLIELRSLRGKNADVIMHLMNKSREEQAAYLRNVESFQNSRRLLQNQARNMLDTLSMEALDRLINKTRDTMTHSWTTAVTTHSEQTRMLIRAQTWSGFTRKRKTSVAAR